MRLVKVVQWLICGVLLFGVIGGLTGDRVVIAASAENLQSGEKLELRTRLPVLTGRAGESFTFEVELIWHGQEFKVFDLLVTAPPGWVARTVGGWPLREIPAIGVEPGGIRPETITVELVHLPWELPEPGEYTAILEVSSGDIKETVELKAVITDLYLFYLATVDGRLNTEAIAGRENQLSIRLGNTGTATIERIELLSEQPTGWSISFDPDPVEGLEPGWARLVDVTIEPPPGTIAGDYMITMSAVSAEHRPRDLELRVTVLTPTIWGWVGVLIVVAVFVGLGLLFRQLGRR